MSRFKGIFLYTGGVLFHMECYIRKLWYSSIILYSTKSIACNIYTNIYPLLNILSTRLHVQGSAADVVMCAMINLWRSEVLKKLGWKLLLQVRVY